MSQIQGFKEGKTYTGRAIALRIGKTDYIIASTSDRALVQIHRKLFPGKNHDLNADLFDTVIVVSADGLTL